MADRRWKDQPEQDERQQGAHRSPDEARQGGYSGDGFGTPPQYHGSEPGYGAHGMGYGPQGGSGLTFGVYGAPHDVTRDYAQASREREPGGFDQPHGRVGYGWSGGYGSGGEHRHPADQVGPAGHPARSESFAFPHSSEQAPQRQRRGPKNYKRSDERVHEDVCERLSHTQHIDARDVLVEVKDGTVSLIGSVPHRQMKYWIEDLVADCPGVTDVENKLRVALTAPWPEPDQLRR